MPKHTHGIPAFLQSFSLCCIAVWWVLFLSWQPGVISFIESLSYRFEPPSISSDTITSATNRALEYVNKGPAVIASDIFFTKDEVSHLHDVSVVYKGMRAIIGIGALFGWTILIGVLFGKRQFSRQIFLQARTIMLLLAFFTLVALIVFPFFFFPFHLSFSPPLISQSPDTSL